MHTGSNPSQQPCGPRLPGTFPGSGNRGKHLCPRLQRRSQGLQSHTPTSGQSLEPRILSLAVPFGGPGHPAGEHHRAGAQEVRERPGSAFPKPCKPMATTGPRRGDLSVALALCDPARDQAGLPQASAHRPFTGVSRGWALASECPACFVPVSTAPTSPSLSLWPSPQTRYSANRHLDGPLGLPFQRSHGRGGSNDRNLFSPGLEAGIPDPRVGGAGPPEASLPGEQTAVSSPCPPRAIPLCVSVS